MPDLFPVVIHHNPGCGTSRNVIAMVAAAGYAPTIVPDLETGWTLGQLQALLAAMGLEARDVLREKDTPAAELGLLKATISEAEILAAMLEHPVLVNRPIVATLKGVKLCRRLKPCSISLSIGRPASPKRTVRWCCAAAANHP